eukprot:jgi/Ulvmu1/9765/UM056_0005.1
MQLPTSKNASIVIRQPDMRNFWATSFNCEVVGWPAFWNALLLWFKPDLDTLVANALQQDSQLREQCQQHMCLQIGSSGHVHISLVDEAFPPDVPVVQQLARFVMSAARTEAGSGADLLLPSTAYQCAHISPFLHDQSALHNMYLSSDCSAKTFLGKLIRLSSQLHSRIRSLTTSSSHHAEIERSDLHVTADGNVSLSQPAMMTDAAWCLSSADSASPHSIISLTRTLEQLKRALEDITSRLKTVGCQSEPCRTPASRTPACIPAVQKPITCITGPALSGKTHLSKRLAQASSERSCLRGHHAHWHVCVRTLDMSGVFHLEQAIGRLSVACSSSAPFRDLMLPFVHLRQCSDNNKLVMLCLDQVDAMPTNHLTDFVRLILCASPGSNVIISSRSLRLEPSQLICHTALQSWSKTLSTAFLAAAQDSRRELRLRASDVLVMNRISRGVPGIVICLAHVVATGACSYQLRSLLERLSSLLEADDGPLDVLAINLTYHALQLECRSTDPLRDSCSPAFASLPAHVSLPGPLTGVLSQCCHMEKCYYAQRICSQGTPTIEALALHVPHEHASCQQHGFTPHQKVTRVPQDVDVIYEARMLEQGCQSLFQHAVLAVAWGVKQLPGAFVCPIADKLGTHVNLRDDRHASSVKYTKRTIIKYIANLVTSCIGLYVKHPITAAILLRKFQPLVWAAFLHCRNRQVIKAIINSFDMLHHFWDRRLIERVLARALRAAAQSDDRLHAKVLILCAKAQHNFDTMKANAPWHDMQSVVEKQFPWPSLPAVKLLLWGPTGDVTPRYPPCIGCGCYEHFGW